ncbi:MAG: hypothetical protein ABID54_03095 [Pseudomonadota bacterium]
MFIKLWIGNLLVEEREEPNVSDRTPGYVINKPLGSKGDLFLYCIRRDYGDENFDLIRAEAFPETEFQKRICSMLKGKDTELWAEMLIRKESKNGDTD